jgi:glucosamine--fructose-6-phosphate aminotransferase (isomerizing)
MKKFLEEIFEQPAALERTLQYYISPEGKDLLEKLNNTIKAEHFEQVIFTGMGSSFFTSHAASILFNSLKINSFVINSSELLHYNLNLFRKKTLLISLSQSGESFEVRQLLNKLPSNVYCVGITNEADSTLAKRADIALLGMAETEEMTSTKTYVVTTLVSFILGWYLAGIWNDERKKMINDLIANFKTTLANYHLWMNDALTFLGDIQTIQIIARGPSFSTASQSALMFKEATRIPATGILGGEFRHGPMEMVSEGFKAILFAADGKTYSQSIKMAEDINEFGGKVLIITNKKLPISNKNIMQIFINEPDEFLFSIQSIIPVQLFIDSYAKSNGREAGNFYRGAKVTTTE